MSDSDPIVIRPFHPDDAGDVHAIHIHPRVYPLLHTLPSLELAETAAAAAKEQANVHRIVAAAGARVIGMGQLFQSTSPRMRHAARLELLVHPDFWRQGIGSQLLTALLRIADEWLDLRRVDGIVTTHNQAALALAQKFGFVSEGTRRMAGFGDGRYLNDQIMARLHPPLPQVNATPPHARPPRRPPQPVLIRPPRPDDVDAITDIFTQPGVARTTNQLPLMEPWRISSRFHNPPDGLYRYMAVIAEAGTERAVGNISLWQPPAPRLRHTGTLGMMVHPGYWGMGIGRRLMAAILDLADNWLNLRRVDLDVHTDNVPAIKLYESCSFAIEGTRRLFSYGDGRWADAHFMARFTPDPAAQEMSP